MDDRIEGVLKVDPLAQTVGGDEQPSFRFSHRVNFRAAQFIIQFAGDNFNMQVPVIPSRQFTAEYLPKVSCGMD
jgi:hypothetical protein